MKRVAKRATALIIALAMVFSMGTVGYATGELEISIRGGVVNDGVSTVTAGELTTFTASIANNPGIAAFTLSVKVLDSNSNDVTSKFTHPTEWLTLTGILSNTGSLNRDGIAVNWNQSKNFSTVSGDIVTMEMTASTDLYNGTYTMVFYLDGDDVVTNEDYDDVDTTFVPFTFNLTGGISTDDLKPSQAALQSATYTYPATATALDATVTTAMTGKSLDSKNVTYQWYKGNEKIDGETSATYTPVLSDFGTASYYCAVTNTVDGTSFTTKSTEAAIAYNKGSITGKTITLNPASKVYDGTSAVPAASIDGLTENTDYTLSNEAKTNVGTYTVTATGAGNYEGTTSAEWSITPATITVNDSPAMTIYTNGNQFAIADTVLNVQTAGGQQATVTYTLKEGSEEYVTLSDGKLTAFKEGTATVLAKIEAANHNTLDNVEITVTIQSKKDVSNDMTFDAKKTEETYTESGFVLSDFISAATYNGGSDNITYTMNDVAATLDTAITKVGTYRVVATYEDDTNLGSKTIIIEIAPKTIEVTLNDIADVDYTGDAITPAVTVNSDYTLIEDTDYSVGYENCINAGTATATVTAKEGSNYTFTEVKKDYTINKVDPTVTAEDIELVYTGAAPEASDIKGTAVFGDNEIDGTWSWTTAPSDVIVSETPYAAQVTFTPASGNFNAVTRDITVTIVKADPEVTPTFTKITSSGKTLADADLGIGSETLDGGTITWLDAEGNPLDEEAVAETQVEANKAYTWQYTPADTANYNVITGTITPYVYISYGSASSSSNTSTTVKNEDGSTTTTTTDSKTGEVTETTKTTTGVTGTTVKDSEGNVTSVSASVPASAAQSGETVTIPVEVETAKTSEAATKVEITIASGAGTVKVEIPATSVTSGTVAIKVNADGTEEIIKTTVATDDGVKITAEGDVTIKIVDNSKSFSDVSDTYWGNDAVNFVASRGIMNGVGNNSFEADNQLNRAMLMTMLARLDGENTDGGSIWYEDGMEWAIAAGISDGSDPLSSITREQVAVMLYRYAGAKSTTSEKLDSFSDGGSISSWAQDGMNWAISVGLMQGDDNGKLNPTGTASRAEVATMLMRFIETVMN